MRFVYGKQELCTRQRAEDVSVLLTNGLGGYLSTTAAFSAPRCDQGLLAAAVQAPNRRVMLVHRLKEVLRIGQKETFLSTQSFAEEAAEDGWKNLSSFTYQYTPCWRYHVGGVMVERKLALGWEENTAAALYTARSSKSLSVLQLLYESHRLRTEPFVVTFDTVRAGGAASAFGSVHIDFGHQPFVNPAARHRFDHRGLDPEMHGDFQFRDNAPSLNVFL